MLHTFYTVTVFALQATRLPSNCFEEAKARQLSPVSMAQYLALVQAHLTPLANEAASTFFSASAGAAFSADGTAGSALALAAFTGSGFLSSGLVGVGSSTAASWGFAASALAGAGFAGARFLGAFLYLFGAAPSSSSCGWKGRT